jgi:hypothetical protein
MNRRMFSIIVGVCALLALLLLGGSVAIAQGPTPPEKISGPSSPAASVGSGFTYQGFLKENGVPANGLYDFRFDLYSDPTGGTVLGAYYLDVPGVTVTNGLFTVRLDFNSLVGANLFNGEARYLHTGVRHAGSGSYSFLSPNQELTAAPYALSLMPGAVISGTAYQELKVENWAPTGGIPAGISGEIYTAADGVGVHGINYNSSAGATGSGVWGRTWSPKGQGVLGNGYNGAIGVFGTATYTGVQGVASNAGGSGVYGENNSAASYAWGVSGRANNASCNYSVLSGGCFGVSGYSGSGGGVIGQTSSGVGVYALSGSGVGLRIESQSGSLIRAYSGPINENLRFEVTNAGNVYADGTYNTPAADMAEMLPAVDKLEPGDVLVVDSDGKLTRSTQPYQASVVGVYSTQPGFVGGAGDSIDPSGKVPLAVVGVVPVKVSAENGAIHPGDLLVASSTPGYAMRASDNPAIGTVIGKALGSLDSGTGIIKMLVMLR